MPDPIETPTEETPQETPGAQEVPGETPPQDPPAEGGVPGEQEDSLPEWARKSLTKARQEAANFRTRLRDAEKALEGAKTPEEFEAARAEFAAENARLERQVTLSTVARKFGLPDDLAALVQGDDQAAMEEHAKALQKYVTPREPENLGGGLNPGDGNDPYAGKSPRELRALARGRR